MATMVRMIVATLIAGLLYLLWAAQTGKVEAAEVAPYALLILIAVLALPLLAEVLSWLERGSRRNRHY